MTNNILFSISSQLNESKINESFELLFNEIKSYLQFDHFRGKLASDSIKYATKRWEAFAEALKISSDKQLPILEVNAGALLVIYFAIAHPDLPFNALDRWNNSPLGNITALKDIMTLNRKIG